MEKEKGGETDRQREGVLFWRTIKMSDSVALPFSPPPQVLFL